MKIEKNVPIPPKHVDSGIAIARKMEIGDSVFVGPEQYSASYSWTKNLKPKRFSRRAEKDGWRIWRVE